jgi:exodeoxyribonuclease VII small subunit
MKKVLTYSEAFSKLEELVEQLENGDIPLDKLTIKVKQANEFLVICETKLKGIESDIMEKKAITSKKIKKQTKA